MAKDCRLKIGAMIHIRVHVYVTGLRVERPGFFSWYIRYFVARGRSSTALSGHWGPLFRWVCWTSDRKRGREGGGGKKDRLGCSCSTLCDSTEANARIGSRYFTSVLFDGLRASFVYRSNNGCFIFGFRLVYSCLLYLKSIPVIAE